MRVYLTSHHVYPARIWGVAGCRVIDNIAKGLAELGHETYYHLGGGSTEALPEGVRPANGPMPDADVWHVQDTNPKAYASYCTSSRLCDGESRLLGTSASVALENRVSFHGFV